MKTLEQLRLDADAKHRAVVADASELRSSLTPRRIINDVVQALDPEFSALNRVETALQKNPIAAVVLAAGLDLLLRRGKIDPATTPQRASIRARPLPTSRLTSKGDHNGKHLNARHD